MVERFSRVKQLFKSRYFGRVFCLCALSLLLLVVLVTSLFFFYTRSILTSNQREADMQMLAQTAGKLENTNTFITNFSASVYFSQAATDVMYGNFGSSPYEHILPNIKAVSSSMVSFAPYIHSVYIYRYSNDTWYSTYTGFGTKVQDEQLQQLIASYETVPVLQPLARQIRAKNLNQEQYTDVFSYFFYETVDEKGRFDGAVVVNVEPRWLLDSIGEGTSATGQFYLMTRAHGFIATGGEADAPFVESLRQIYADQVVESIAKGVHTDMLSCEIEGMQYLVSYSYLPDKDFVLFKTESADHVYRAVNQTLFMVVVIAAVLVLVSVAISLLMSGSIYRPVRKLMTRFDTQDVVPVTGRLDEFGMLEHEYARNSRIIGALRKQVASASDIKYNYYLMQLLVNSKCLSQQEYEEISRSQSFHISLQQPVLLMILRLEDKLAAELPLQGLDDAERWLTEELHRALDQYATNDTVFIQPGYVVALVNPDLDNELKMLLRVLYREVDSLQRALYARYGLSFATIFSELIRVPQHISSVFATLQQNLEYRYILGSNAIITTERIAKNLAAQSANYPLQKETRLVREIKAQNQAGVESLLDDILDSIAVMNYSNIVTSLFRLCNIVRDTVQEIDRSNFVEVHTDTLGSNPMEYATIFELRESLLAYISNSFVKDTVSHKHRKMVDSTIRLIENQYSDPNLCLIGIADVLKISPNYLNQIFKGVCGSSISNYITDYRLDVAASLIAETTDNINVIIEKVGIENESFFYKRFKAKFGTTPRNYLLGKRSSLIEGKVVETRPELKIAGEKSQLA